MMIFRVIEKLGLNQMLGNGWVQYLVTVILVILGASVFAVAMQWVLGRALGLITGKGKIACQKQLL